MKIIDKINFIVTLSVRLEREYFQKKFKVNQGLEYEDSFLNIYNARLNRVFNSMSMLIQSNGVSEEMSLFVLLRVLIQDAMFMFYCYHEVDKSENMENRLLVLSQLAICDGIDKNYTFAKNAKGIVDELTDEKLKSVLNEMITNNPEVIDSQQSKAENKIIFKKFIKDEISFRASAIFKKMKTIDECKIEIWGLYDDYTKYSKYDHFTLVGYELMQESSKENKLKSVEISVFRIISHYSNFLSMLKWYSQDKNVEVIYNEFSNWLKIQILKNDA